MRILRYNTLKSTNSEAARIVAELKHGDVVTTHEQTAGRGQRGNTWESEPGKNLTFTVFLRPPRWKAADSFLLSMVVSIAIVDSLNDVLEPETVKIKWPNDIYWRDLKLAGILIENSFNGPYIDHSIIGIGLNVNQTVFVSDAPNPVSMARITGIEYNLDSLLQAVSARIIHSIDAISFSNIGATIVMPYHSRLWRRDGMHLWREPEGQPFEASIVNVDSSGCLTLEKPDGSRKKYVFKEIFPVL